MLLKSITLMAACLVLAACAADKPHIVQASSNTPEVRLTGGLATQIEMPASEHVQSVVTGNPALVTAEKADTVVNLIPKEGSMGATNLIVRTIDDSGDSKVYQYRIMVQDH